MTNELFDLDDNDRKEYDWLMNQFTWMMRADIKLGSHKKYIHNIKELSTETQVEIVKAMITHCELDGGISKQQMEVLEYTILYLRLDKLL